MSVSKARSRLAHEAKRAKRHPSDETAERIEAARRDLAAEKLEEYIKRVVALSPPLTPEQKARLSILIRGGQS